MAVAKVILNGSTLIDVTQKTVVADKLLSGYTALKNDGTDITGSYSAPSGTKSITISGAGTTTEDVTNYASVQITTPAGSASITNDSAPLPISISVDSQGYIHASASSTLTITPTVSAGYVTSGTSGHLTVTGTGTSRLDVYDGSHHSATPTTSTVTISLTNPTNSSYFQSCEIYKALNGQPYSSFEKIGEITSATGNTEVTVDESLYGLEIQPLGVGGYQYVDLSGISCTGGAEYIAGYSDAMVFRITGNGTITIDGINWNDD